MSNVYKDSSARCLLIGALSAVSGATYSSNGIMNAVADALSQAQ